MARRLLLIDDDDDLLKCLEARFLQAGYEVHAVREREEAEALLSFYQYEVVVTDLSLTTVGVEGIELVALVANLCPRPKVIVVSGHAAKEFRQAAYQEGADAFLAKPVLLSHLVDQVALLLEGGA